jgi:hypothetical protein
MQRLPQEMLRQAYNLLSHEDGVSNQVVIRLKRKPAEEFCAQITFCVPSEDEVGVLKSVKRVVKLFVQHQLQTKL